jgi:ribonuclease D
MTVNTKPTPLLVYTPKALRQMITQLRKRVYFALDTESDSLYSYQGRVCLIQISAPDGDGSGMVDYLVDPLRLDDVTPLGDLLADAGHEVVMHAADNDMLTLFRSYGFTFARIFDTQLAARILGWKQVGLAAILEKNFGLVSDKRMQRTDWGKRPLTPQQIAYAVMDTHYLLPLRDQLVDELKASDRWEEAQDAFAMLAAADQSLRQTDERTFWGMRATRDVEREQHGVLEALWQWREETARIANRPPFKVVNDSVLIAMTQQQPQSLDAMRAVEGLSDLQVRRYGAAMLAALNSGRTRPLPPLPNGDSRADHLIEKPAQARYDALRRWRTETARQRGVDPDIVLPNSTLLAIAQLNPATPEGLATVPDLGAWKAANYGAQILATLAKVDAAQSIR